MTESFGAPLEGAEVLARVRSGSDVPDHVLTSLVASLVVLFDDLDVLMEAAQGPTRRRVAAQIDGHAGRVEADLEAVRVWLDRYVPGPRDAADDGHAPGAAGGWGDAP